MQTDGYESQYRYGYENDDEETDEVNEPITESEYHEKLNAIIASCKGHWSFKYAQNLNLEGNLSGDVPMIALDCLGSMKGLTGTKVSDLVAVLIALDDRRVQRAIKAFYDSKYPELRRALYDWGKLQSVRG